MPTLYRTNCTTDRKCRPTHSLKLLATSDDRQWLIEMMNEDVQSWQQDDIDAENEILREEYEENGIEFTPITKWEGTDSHGTTSRFEMEDSGDLRLFAIHDQESDDRSTVAYHIVQDVN